MRVFANGSGNPLLQKITTKVSNHILGLKNEDDFLRDLLSDLVNKEIFVSAPGGASTLMVSCTYLKCFIQHIMNSLTLTVEIFYVVHQSSSSLSRISDAVRKYSN